MKEEKILSIDEMCTLIGIPVYNGIDLDINRVSIVAKSPDLEYWMCYQDHDEFSGVVQHFFYYTVKGKDAGAVSRGIALFRRGLDIAKGNLIDLVFEKEGNTHDDEISYLSKLEISSNRDLMGEIKKARGFVEGWGRIYAESEQSIPPLKQKIIDAVNDFQFIKHMQSSMLREAEKEGKMSNSDYSVLLSGYKALSELQTLISFYEEQTRSTYFEKQKEAVRVALEGTQRVLLSILLRERE